MNENRYRTSAATTRDLFRVRVVQNTDKVYLFHVQPTAKSVAILGTTGAVSSEGENIFRAHPIETRGHEVYVRRIIIVKTRQ